MELLRFYKIDPSGKVACVIGRSSIVGKPMAALLLQANATLIHCHSKTPNMAELSKQADILVVAAGKPGLIGSRFIKKGAVVIDVGIHRNSEGKIVGDVLFDEVAPLCHAITPVPGGVGPMTISTLLQNTIRAALKEF
jgi:methylenetetrahydrofolate dehydrogenase (NADP+)/methenyltetrahydrofolate cyclohydrolase